jgi:hypothetical protein
VFLGRLKDEMDRAREMPVSAKCPSRRDARLGEMSGSTQQHHGMAVMTAGVHAPGLLRGMGEIIHLGDMQRVRVSARQTDDLVARSLESFGVAVECAAATASYRRGARRLG